MAEDVREAFRRVKELLERARSQPEGVVVEGRGSESRTEAIDERRRQ